LYECYFFSFFALEFWLFTFFAQEKKSGKDTFKMVVKLINGFQVPVPGCTPAAVKQHWVTGQTFEDTQRRQSLFAGLLFAVLGHSNNT
jgi:hypothetical protein